MHLKRLELFGFKSFADRTVLGFEPGLTGVVGPNGCGKSNVVDAVRWVLGEQRPTSMRGSEMVDVIFKGSSARPALSVAEVALVLDNACGTLEGRGAEVSITRRVFRSGEGEYLLDGEKVRLKDLRNLLYNTGLGSRGYSVLEQGKIDAVLSADPLERRGIFEEAAGVSRFRAQRKEIAARLQRVEQDLLRLDDVIGELESRVRSLKIQSGKAERYAAARDAWRSGAERLARHQLAALRGELERLSRALAEQAAAEAEQRAAREEAEAACAERERELAALQGELERGAQSAADLAGELRALDERREQLGRRASAARASSTDESERAARLQEKHAERERELAQLEAESTELASALELARARANEQADALREAGREQRAVREQSQQQNERVLACLRERTAAQNSLEMLEASLAPLAERARRAGERAEEARATLVLAREKGAASAAEEGAVRARLAEAESRAAQLAGRAAELQSARGALATAQQERELERARARSRIESLLDWEREQEGLSAGSRALLAAPGAQGEQLHGLLADRLHTSTRYARALDAVLGERAQALVARDAGTAIGLVEQLKRQQGGLARFIVPSGLADLNAPRSAAALALAAERELAVERLGAARVLGPLRAQVRADAGFERVADALLEDVWLVADIESARELAASQRGLRCVTPEGDLVDELGLLGGHREVAQGPIGRRSSAEELEAVAAALSEELERDARAAAELDAERAELERARSACRVEIEAGQVDLARSRAEVDLVRTRCADLEQSEQISEREAASARAERERALAEVESARTRLGSARTEFENENAALNEVEARRAALELERDRLAREESSARVEAGRLAEQAQGLAARRGDLERGLAEGGAELERARRLAREQHELALASAAESDELAGQRVQLLEARGALEVRIGELRALEKGGRREIELLRARADEVTRALEARLQEHAQLALEQQRGALAREELLRRSQEDLGMDELALAADFEPEPALQEAAALAELAEAVAEARRALERLGPVNLEAVGELREVSGRLDFLLAQRADVVAARGSLDGTLGRINSESERLFLETFEQIRTNFQALFRRLFGGGKADIELAKDASVLEAGIEISARPPGREMLPIGLLSGGQRTMTALALLFAVFEARPSPFCMLDEVDAALDDLNIARFLDMLAGFQGRTQFVVVTHNKGTMSACEALYGITMEVRGVSRHVSVELAEVERFVPEATGTLRAHEQEPRARESVQASEDEPANEEDAPAVELVPAARRAAPARESASATRDASKAAVEPAAEGSMLLPQVSAGR